MRIIKKYPNRRLYDTERSRYITLADVRSLVMNGVDLMVTDSASKEDITRSILLQIMLEEESDGEPLFTARMLSQIIRFYSGTLQAMFARYLEVSLDLFAKQQQQAHETFGDNPIEAMGKMVQHNMRLWNEMQENFLRAATLSAGDDDGGAENEKQPQSRHRSE